MKIFSARRFAPRSRSPLASVVEGGLAVESRVELLHGRRAVEDQDAVLGDLYVAGFEAVDERFMLFFVTLRDLQKGLLEALLLAVLGGNILLLLVDIEIL